MTLDQTPRVTDHPVRLEARPLYQQIRDLLVKRIIDGIWRPGSYLPSEQQLCTELGVSIGTIRKAMEDLVSQGILERQHGRGTQVVAHSSAQSRFRFLRFVHADGRPLDPVAHLLRQSIRNATLEERRQLELDAHEKVLVLLRTRSEAGQPLVYEKVILPAEMFAQLDLKTGADISEEIYVFYQKRCGVTIMRTQDQIGLDSADAAIAEALGTKTGEPVLHVRRISFGLDGRRVEYRQSWSARLKYQTELD